VILALTSSQGLAQREDAPAPTADQAQKNASPPSTKTPYRPLAPGVMITIDPMRESRETVDRHDVVEVLAVDPKLSWAKDVWFHRDVWVLEFKFKPVRIIEVDIPQRSGYMQRKPIWYMVYSVTNTGKVLHPVEDVELSYETGEKKLLYRVDTVDAPVRFVPEFLLEAHVRRPDHSVLAKVYPDRVIPLAMGAIRMREDPNRRFLTSVEMSRKLEFGETQWGVATWEDIDPKTFMFSVYVVGLTNAYRWTDEKGVLKPGDDPISKGRKLYRKTLKLNFWRPGDQYREDEKEIRYGVPLGLPGIRGGVDYEWVYR
jgi:hypothetical protein